jgi:hypothetical protein
MIVFIKGKAETMSARRVHGQHAEKNVIAVMFSRLATGLLTGATAR